MVDDSEDDVLLIIRNLIKGGYDPEYERVDTADAMKKALDEKKWDIVLCDYEMPSFDGPSAITLLKQTNLNIPIIIISGAIGEETAIQCMLLGAQDYLMKNNLSRLCSAVARELEEAKVRNREKLAKLQKDAALESLRKSEEKYRTIIENIEEGYAEMNLRGNFIFFNDALSRINGYPKEELMTMNYRDVMDKENARKVFAVYNRVFKTGKPETYFEYEIITKNGEKKFLDSSVSAVKNHFGTVVAFRSIVRDTTERRKAEEDLRRSEEKYRNILGNIREGYFEVDLAGNFTFFNDSLCRMSGFTRNELMGMSYSKISADEATTRKVFQTFNRVYKTGIPSEGFDWPVIRKDGSRGYIEASILLKKDSVGGTVGFQGIVRDITERKQAEKKLKETEERYRALFDHSIDLVCIMDFEGRFIDANTSAMKLFGYTRKEIAALNIASIMDEEQVPVALGLIQQIRKTGTQKEFVELKLRRKDGSYIDVETQGTVVMSDGVPVTIEVVARDVTERNKAMEDIRKTQEQMRAFAARLQTVREEERTSIAREIHDELGGALTGIKIDFSLLKKAVQEIKEKPLKDRLLDQMHDTTGLIDKTIGTIRKISSQLRPGILDDLGILAALEWQLNDFQKRTGIDCKWTSLLTEINLNEQEATALFRIFQETLTNIFRHARASQVHVQLSSKSDAYILDVKDNGKGITENNMSDKKSLGLLSMRERALAIGGRIKIEGRPEKGTRVTVEIPVKQTDKH